ERGAVDGVPHLAVPRRRRRGRRSHGRRRRDAVPAMQPRPSSPLGLPLVRPHRRGGGPDGRTLGRPGGRGERLRRRLAHHGDLRHVHVMPVLTRVLAREEWEPLAQAHAERARVHTEPHLARRRAGRTHPVADFLFEYYNLSPGALERWHPGLRVGLADAPEYAALGAYVEQDGVVTVDPSRMARRVSGWRWTRELLRRTASRPARTGCFGLHEWAMVYREPEERRHSAPLRLGAEGTDRVVESHRLVCTHVDAFRFFTAEARPLNVEILEREHQLEREQPGCLHATMDLYRIAFR